MLHTTEQHASASPIARRRLGGDRYRDQVIALVAKQGFQVSDGTREQDMKEASDLLLDGQGCALRIRAEKALQRWPDEFTIRARRPECGADTEFRKIMDGHARYALYGFTDGKDQVVLMRLLDLDVLRTCLLACSRQDNLAKYDRNLRTGEDGVGYLVFNIREFPPTLVRFAWDYRH